jgi:hypothetical protein
MGILIFKGTNVFVLEKITMFAIIYECPRTSPTILHSWYQVIIWEKNQQ